MRHVSQCSLNEGLTLPGKSGSVEKRPYMGGKNASKDQYTYCSLNM